MNTKTKQISSEFTKHIAASGATILGIILLMTAFLFLVPYANATTVKTPKKISKTDKSFMKAAGQINLLEIELGNYAAKNGQSAGVKEFGLRMVKDHTVLNQKLELLAGEKAVSVPQKLNAKHKKMVDKMMKLKGSKFDKAYIAAMTKGHKKAIKTFQAEVAKTKDPTIKQFATKAISILQEHLKLVTELK